MIEQLKINVLGSYHVTNCYIIWDKDSKEAAVIDPADDVNKIENCINMLGLNLKYAVLTHAHKDHTIALYTLLEKYDIKVIASEDEKLMLEGKVSDCSEVFHLRQTPFDLNRFILLKNNDIFNIGNIRVKIIYTPGHTKGSACYYLEKEKVLFTGDTLFSDCFGRCDLDSSNIDDMVDSLILLFRNYNDVYIYPGHNLSNIHIMDTYPKIRSLLISIKGLDLDKLL